jgi:CheY-like chemotaxis protein
VDYSILSTTATDGLRLLAGGDISLVFLDYNLPDMNGQNFLELKKPFARYYGYFGPGFCSQEL